jgi:4-alpha-glucanotransferase
VPEVNTGDLHRLARLYRVQTTYDDVSRRRRRASDEALLAVLRVLGAPVASPDDVPSALRERRQAIWRRVLPPVVVAWGGSPPEIRVNLPADDAMPLTARLELESGEVRGYRYRAADLPVLESAGVEGAAYLARRLALPEGLPDGYHNLILELPGGPARARLIAAPVRNYLPEDEKRLWGPFLPLYALRDKDGWGSGDFSALGGLADWTASLGGGVTATLPLLPAFLDEPLRPSPYAPVSRRLWNEFYLDILRVPELALCPEAQAMIASAEFQAEIAGLRAASLVDYRRQMALKRRVLEALCRCLFSGSSERLAAFQRFLREHPVVADYARFRAVMEKRREPWPAWPSPLRGGTLPDDSFDAGAERYHQYVQWLAHQQVAALAERSRQQGVRLYFDLPVGVHPDGYDVWREQDIFGLGASAGAPPDAVFTAGQDWRFPPLHPEKIREQGYGYVIGYLRHHLRHAGLLRLDHVMGLHRLFWIPPGIEASQGVYVRYHAEELYAILALESHRGRSIIIGEDLGMVPSYVRPAMARHGLQRMYIVNYELTASPQQAFGQVPPNAVASLNTHDMFPFAAYWAERDIVERLKLGLLDEGEARREDEARRAVKDALVAFLRGRGLLGEAADRRAVMAACLKYLSAGPARLVLVNLEDLWGETRPQNVPSTDKEYPNWQRKARYTFEEFREMPAVREVLEEIDRLRKAGPSF